MRQLSQFVCFCSSRAPHLHDSEVGRPVGPGAGLAVTDAVSGAAGAFIQHWAGLMKVTYSWVRCREYSAHAVPLRRPLRGMGGAWPGSPIIRRSCILSLNVLLLVFIYMPGVSDGSNHHSRTQRTKMKLGKC